MSVTSCQSWHTQQTGHCARRQTDVFQRSGHGWFTVTHGKTKRLLQETHENCNCLNEAATARNTRKLQLSQRSDHHQRDIKTTTVSTKRPPPERHANCSCLNEAHVFFYWLFPFTTDETANWLTSLVSLDLGPVDTWLCFAYPVPPIVTHQIRNLPPSFWNPGHGSRRTPFVFLSSKCIYNWLLFIKLGLPSLWY